ncbi:MAG TPA: RNA pseudouridine synthase [Candidatus Synoicihabitans sp.]|nr:RNA pseudouridine synthase [Candidatus Synoicihabitans sp.]
MLWATSVRRQREATVLVSDLWVTLPLGRGVSVVAHDRNGLGALAKPAGTLSHPNRGGEESRALLTVRYVMDGEYYEWTPPDAGTEPRRLWLLNRLDAATSGVILVAAEERLAHAVRAMFREKRVHKVYAAVVFGVAIPVEQTWKDRLAVDKRGGQVRTTVGGNIPAEARMRLVKSTPPRVHPPRSLIRLEPKTGRSHQLRAQCAKRHLPIIGDATYGDFALNRAFTKKTGEKRMFLHSLETKFTYEWAGAKHRFAAQAPVPDAFTAALMG